MQIVPFQSLYFSIILHFCEFNSKFKLDFSYVPTIKMPYEHLLLLRAKRLENGVNLMCNGIVCYSHLLPVRSMWEGYAFELVYVRMYARTCIYNLCLYCCFRLTAQNVHDNTLFSFFTEFIIF